MNTEPIISNQPTNRTSLPIGPNAAKKHQEFPLNSRITQRLDTTFNLYNRSDLIGRTLLDDDIHCKHARILEERFIRKFRKIKKRELAHQKRKHLASGSNHPLVPYTEHQIAANTTRLITLLHEVVELDSDAAVQSAMNMKKQIVTAIEKIDGMTCLGAIEIEVISIPLMEELHTARETGVRPPDTDDPIEPYRVTEIEKTTIPNEYRKLETCKALAGPFMQSIFKSERSQLLVHFHGVLISQKKSDFDKLADFMRSNPQWKIAPRQIEIKNLSRHFGKDKKTGKPNEKSIEESLSHIANYVTKGGMDLRNKSTCLKLKFRFSDGTPISTKEFKAITDRASWLIKNTGSQYHSKPNNYDPLALSSDEIFVLGETIDKLMNKDTTRTGYTICEGRW